MFESIMGLVIWLILLVCVDIGISQSTERKLYWTFDRESTKGSSLVILGGDPELWLDDVPSAHISSLIWLWNTSDFRTGLITSDNNLPNQYFIHDRNEGKIVQFEFVTDDRTIQTYRGASNEVRGMTVDWVGQNLYYTDGRMICLWSYKNTRYQVILEHTSRPHGIDVDPVESFIFWSDPTESKIWRSSLAGTNTQTIHTGLAGPRAVTVDTSTQTLFWISQNTNSLETSDYDGGSRSVVINQFAEASFGGMDIYKDFIFVHGLDDSTLYGFYSNGTYINGATITTPGTYFQHGVSMASPETQPMISHLCGQNNGGCQHVCVPDKTASTCLCQFGYTLNTDLTNCETDYILEEVIFVVDTLSDHIYQVELSTGVVHDLEVSTKIVDPKVVTFDPIDNMMYWTDRGPDRNIRRRSLTTAQEDVFKTLGVAECGALSVDAYRRILYYGNDDTHTINSISLVTGQEKTLINLGPAYITRGIALDTVNGHIYWSKTGDTGSSITRADSVTGLNELTIVSTDIQSPYGMTLDIPDGKLYWCDLALNKVERISLDGTGREFMSQTDSATCYDVAVDSDFVYVTSHHTISKINKVTKARSVLGHSLYWYLSGLSLYSPSYMPIVAPKTASSMSTTKSVLAETSGMRKRSSPTVGITSMDVTTTLFGVNSDDQPGLQLTTLIAICVCVGGVLFIAIIVAVVVVLVRKNQASRTNRVEEVNMNKAFDPEPESTSPEDRHAPQAVRPASPRESAYYEDIDGVVDDYVMTTGSAHQPAVVDQVEDYETLKKNNL